MVVEFIISKKKRDEKMDIQIHIITYMQFLSTCFIKDCCFVEENGSQKKK